MGIITNMRLRNLAKQIDLEVNIQQSRQVMAALSALGTAQLKKTFEDEDESSWINLSGYGARHLDEQQSGELQAQAAKLYYKNGHARGIIRLFEKYVVGRGFTITPTDDCDPVREYWKDFWRINKMERRKKEIVRRGMRDGEVFIRKFIEDGMLVVRFMNPEKVKRPDTEKEEGNASHGILTDADDVEKVLAYYYKGDRVEAADVIHEKILVDSDVKRGRSFLEIVAKLTVMYQKWLDMRMKLNFIRSLIGLHRKVEGSPTQAANLAAGYETNKRKAPDGTAMQKTPEGVSIITTNKGVEYDFKTPNLQATDVQHDGRAILLAMAAASGLPEYMVTGDASNSNMASTLIAEAPGVMEFEDWQDFWAETFKTIYKAVIDTGIEKGEIPARYVKEETSLEIDELTGATVEVTESVKYDVTGECDVVFPEIVHRKILDETKALVMQKGQGWLSDQTASARLDLEYDEEQRKIEQEELRRGERMETPEDYGYDRSRDEELGDLEDEENPGGAAGE